MRLDEERQARESRGHLWLHGRGLLHVPETLYRLTDTAVYGLRVDRVTASLTAGAAPGGLVVTPDQFNRFLVDNQIPVADMNQYLADAAGFGQSSFVYDIPYRTRTDTVFIPASGAPELFSLPKFTSPDESPFPFRSASFGGGASTWPSTAPMHGGLGANDFATRPTPCPGGCHGAPRRGMESFDVRETSRRATVRDYLDIMSMNPHLYTAEGDERVYLPAPPQPQSARSMMERGGEPIGGASPTLFGSPAPFAFDAPVEAGPMPWMGMTSLGTMARPAFPLPYDTSGVMWEGSHTTSFSIDRGRITARGFRASARTHHRADVERAQQRGGGPVTAELNRGTTRGTAYYNDWFFPYMSGGVAVLRADGSRVDAAELRAIMDTAVPEMKGAVYTRSTPPVNNPAYARAFGDPPPPGFVPPPAMNCINRPCRIHSAFLGGDYTVLEQPDGTVISLADPQHASAENMRRWINLPDEWFAARGLRKVPINTGAMRRRLAAPGLFGVLGAAAGEGYSASQGEEFRYENVVLGLGSGVGSQAAESYLAPRATTLLRGAGMRGGASMVGGRLIAGTGVGGLLAAPVEMLSMAFSDEEYTRIAYAARGARGRRRIC